MNTPNMLRLLLIVFLAAAPAAFCTNYYFSPTGDDGLNGRTAATAWKSLSKLSALIVQPGDSILLKGGAACTSATALSLWKDIAPGKDGIYGTADDSVSGNMPLSRADTPVVITAFPASNTPATLVITANDQPGLDIYNVEGVEIRNLTVRGPGAATNSRNGISFFTDLPTSAKLRHLRVDTCDVSGFSNGITVGAWPRDYGPYPGFTDVRITRSSAHDNRSAGITSWGMWPDSISARSHSNIYVGYCRAYNNKGDPAYTANHSGNGIVLGNVSGGRIEYCLAYNNGELNASAQGNGPVGIWVWEADHFCIQHCISHHNKSGNNCDGGGFDLDGGAVCCTLQYNYSYHNVGSGFLVCQFNGASRYGDNVVRYNVSENDGGASGLGGIHFYSPGTGINTLRNVEIYGNTVYDSVSAPVRIYSSTGMANVRLWNNIFLAGGGKRIIDGNPSASAALFQGNAYWSTGGTVYIAGYASLAAWRSATGQEMLSVTPTGIQADPLLASPGKGDSITEPLQLFGLSAYKLLNGSPCINRGLNIQALFGKNPGPIDFFGNMLPQDTAYDIGAHEFPLQTSVPGNTPVIGRTGVQGIIRIQTQGAITRFIIAPQARAKDISVYDISGRLVKRILVPKSGTTIAWNGRNVDGELVPQGIYVAGLSSGNAVLKKAFVRL